jgi:autotransporter-associated beta strand protein
MNTRPFPTHYLRRSSLVALGFGCLALALPSHALITWSGGTNTITGTTSDNSWLVSGGTNTVQAGGILDVPTGGTGLVFTGTASPTITLNSTNSGTEGLLHLHGNLTLDSGFTSGTAQILNGGTLNKSGAIDLQNGSRIFTINDGSADIDLLITAAINSGNTSGAIIKEGAGTMQLTSPTGDTSDYKGNTTINAGTLVVTTLEDTGSTRGAAAGKQLLINNNATLRAADSFVYYNRVVTLGTTGGSNGGTIDVVSGKTLKIGDTLDGTLIPGYIQGAGATFTKAGTGTLELGGPSTYTGATVISGGTLKLTPNHPTIPSGSGSLADSTALNITSGTGVFDISTITGTGETIGSLAGVAGSSVVLGAKTLTVGGDLSSTLFAGALSGTGGGLTKTGTGIMTLSAASSHTGITTVSGGTLNLVNTTGSATGDSQVTVDAGQTLAGTGAAVISSGTNSLYLNGNLLVGDATALLPSPSMFTIGVTGTGTGSTVMGVNSSIQVDLFFGAGLGDNTLSAGASDYIKLFGLMDTVSGGTLKLGNPNSMNAFSYGDTWRLFDLTSGTINSGFSVDATALGLTGGLVASFDSFNGTLSIVPEPSRAVLTLSGLIIAMARRRRPLVA